MFEFIELIGERLDLLYLAVDHLDELCDLLRRVDDRLDGVRRVVNDPLRACRHVMPSVTSASAMNFFIMSLSLMSLFAGWRQRPANHAKGFIVKQEQPCIARTTFNEVRAKGKAERHAGPYYTPRAGFCWLRKIVAAHVA